MKLIEKTVRHDMTCYMVIGVFGLTIAHEQIICWNADKILVAGIGDIGFWFGTPKTQVHIFLNLK